MPSQKFSKFFFSPFTTNLGRWDGDGFSWDCPLHMLLLEDRELVSWAWDEIGNMF